jgi:ERF superfamily
MQRSSDSIGALAAALAKAQAEIENPQKSLTATIVSPFPREGMRSFRYAPLSSGLDLVRKCLGQHEIATVQSTAIDGDSGLIRLTTTLVHASGEWVSSDWPVCPVSETAAPHRLGAALTYARRYALFTLVGIAGEDDLDAPDLLPTDGAAASRDVPLGPDKEIAATLVAAVRPPQTPERRSRSERSRPPTLSADASDELRRRLLSEIETLKTSEALATWAHRALPMKNQLTKADAQTVEDVFTARLGQLVEPAAPNNQASGHSNPLLPVDPGEQTVSIIRKPVRERDREHLTFVASQPCLLCGRTPSDAHHIKFAEQRAMGRKVSDRFTVPICRLHHRELHRKGNERAWWEKQEIDPLVIAASLWGKTHGVVPVAENIADDRPTTTNGKLNGRHFKNGAGAARRAQNNETKPILDRKPE